MGKSKKRASSPPRPGESGLIDQARLVAEAAFKDLQKRLPADVVAACAETATIPLAGGAESLNVAAVGAIALYDWSRR